jgi:hypothetical protein
MPGLRAATEKVSRSQSLGGQRRRDLGKEADRDVGEAAAQGRLAILRPEALICSGLRALYKFG